MSQLMESLPPAAGQRGNEFAPLHNCINGTANKPASTASSASATASVELTKTAVMSSASRVIFTPRGVLPGSYRREDSCGEDTIERASGSGCKKPQRQDSRQSAIEELVINQLTKDFKNELNKDQTLLGKSQQLERQNSGLSQQNGHAFKHQYTLERQVSRSLESVLHSNKCNSIEATTTSSSGDAAPSVADADDCATNEPPFIDVKLIDGKRQLQLSQRRKKRLSTRSVEDLERQIILCNDVGDVQFKRDRIRSSFMGDERPTAEPALYKPDGCYDVQTVLKHSQQDNEHIYSLPEQQCYSDSTWRAVKMITEKYDTANRRKLHAMSFRQGDLIRGRRQSSDSVLSALSSLDGGVTAANNGIAITRENGCGGSAIAANVGVDTPVVVNGMAIIAEEAEVVCPASGLTKNDVTRIDLFYQAMETQVFVSSCVVDVYFGQSPCVATSNGDFCAVTNLWKGCSGVPLLVLTTGCMGRKRRELRLVIAEIHTGFTIWDDKINYLSNYGPSPDSADTHQLRLSESLRTVAQLRFCCPTAAVDFMQTFLRVTNNPNDELWHVRTLDLSIPRRRSRKSKTGVGGDRKSIENGQQQRREVKKIKLPAKKDISAPCNFIHVTNVDQSDVDLVSLLLLLAENGKERFTGRPLSSVHSSTAAQNSNKTSQ